MQPVSQGLGTGQRASARQQRHGGFHQHWIYHQRKLPWREAYLALPRPGQKRVSSRTRRSLCRIREDKPYNEVESSAYSTMTAIMGRMATYSGTMVEWED